MAGRSGVQISVGVTGFRFTKSFTAALAPNQPASQWVQPGRVIMLPTHPYQEPRLRMSGAILLYPPTQVLMA
jgi:hypothetical protein